MNLMSDTRQNELLAAVTAAAQDHCATGILPNDALIKQAQACKATANEVDLMAHAFNTARTHYQFKTAAPMDRAETFPLADADVIKAATIRDVPKAEAYSQDESIPDYRLDKAASMYSRSIGSEVRYNGKTWTVQKTKEYRLYDDRSEERRVGKECTG